MQKNEHSKLRAPRLKIFFLKNTEILFRIINYTISTCWLSHFLPFEDRLEKSRRLHKGLKA
jgi:hypothetical protein